MKRYYEHFLFSHSRWFWKGKKERFFTFLRVDYLCKWGLSNLWEGWKVLCFLDTFLRNHFGDSFFTRIWVYFESDRTPWEISRFKIQYWFENMIYNYNFNIFIMFVLVVKDEFLIAISIKFQQTNCHFRDKTSFHPFKWSVSDYLLHWFELKCF